MGYEPGIAPEPVSILTQEVLEELLPMGDIRAEYRVFENISFDPAVNCVEVEGIVFYVKPVVYRQIRYAAELALFICTAGPAIGEMSRRLMKEGDLLKGYIYDVVGSEVVENAADRIQEELKAEAETRGERITNRFSPGYCGWDVAEQHKLFNFFRNNFCGITLTESALMNPVKSVSGIMGIGTDVIFEPYQCHLCEDKMCIYRNKRP